MPILHSHYRSPAYLFNGHLQTIVPSVFRKIEGIQYERETIATPDGDFLDIDWLKRKSNRLVILSHGLEGSSDRHYIKGMAKYFHQREWDVLAWNCRSCSGRINLTPRLYHHAATDDLASVMEHALSGDHYSCIVLIGFSMGGSLTLKYLGEQNGGTTNVTAAVVFSVPCDLQSSSKALDKSSNTFYRKRFLKKLKKKLSAKAEQFPALIDLTGFDDINSFTEFDNRYTAPLHGFRSADDFYEQASANRYLHSINTPTLICNALNDPILAPACYPYDAVRDHPFIFLETPASGGHGGFPLAGMEENGMDVRAYEFVREICGH